MPSQYIVRLTAEERVQLEDLIRTGKRAAAALIHARMLLKADVGEGGPGWDDGRITEAVGCGASTGYRGRQAFVEAGLTVALFRKKPTGRQYRKLDGVQEAHLLALACGSPPDGRHRWTLRLLADRLMELAVVDSISPEGVRLTLKKTTSSPGCRNRGESRPKPTRRSGARWNRSWTSTLDRMTRRIRWCAWMRPTNK